MLKNVGAGGGAGAIAEVDEEGDLTERKVVKKANTGLSVTWEDQAKEEGHQVQRSRSGGNTRENDNGGLQIPHSGSERSETGSESDSQASSSLTEDLVSPSLVE